MNRQHTAETFRQRLTEVLDRLEVSRSAFATEIGLDRSTLSQLFSPTNDRLPRAETIVAIADAAQVSVDWLLGVSQDGQLGTDVVANALEIAEGAASPADARLLRWQAEAAGQKIRYVPSTLPDLLKTQEVIEYEYQEYGTRVSEGRIEHAEARLEYSRRPETEFDICTPRQALEAFARGQDIWSGLDAAVRRAQLESMIGLLDELYPSVRWFLYDGLQRYSAPVSVFGSMRAALYVGNMYFVFNSTEQVRVLSRHFDELIRAAVVQPPDVIKFIEGLLQGSLPTELPAITTPETPRSSAAPQPTPTTQRNTRIPTAD